jgi:biopolymer transport protein ExbB
MLQQSLLSAGPVIYPLILCSVIALILVIERFLSLCRYRPKVSKETLQEFKNGTLKADACPVSMASFSARGGLLLLSQHRHFSKPLRDEVLSEWLEQQRRFLHARTRWLLIIAGAAPLLGLLGTVLGIIEMFQNVAHQTGPITPAVLASGMWQAMATTALGLVVAIPALVIGQGITVWADHCIEIISSHLNQLSLWLESEWESGRSESTPIKPLAQVSLV